MNKKNNINKWGVIFGLFLMYIGTYIFLVNTTNNNSNKDYTYISKVFAKLQFFQNQTQTTQYKSGSTILYNGKWASRQYPNSFNYSTGVVRQTNTVFSKSKFSTGTKDISVIIPKPPRPPVRIRRSH